MFKILMISNILLLGCSNNKIRNKNLEISIDYAQSFKCDLTKMVYTVFYLDKQPTEIKFHLSDEEKSRIIDKYYDLDIDEIKGDNKMAGNIIIEDDCMIMPKLYNLLQVKSNNLKQDIQIDEECDEYPFQNKIKAKRIKQLIDFITKIIKSKPEIKDAPKSNIIYM